MARFAEVVVNAPLYRPAHSAQGGKAPGLTLHYSVPPELVSTLQVGHLVKVPLREREVHGVVIGLGDESPVAETRPVLALVYPEPVLTPLQLSLARWLAETYFASLVYAIKLFLPPGMMVKSEPMLARVPGVSPPPNLTPEQQVLLARLANGPQPERMLKVGGRSLASSRVVDPLLAHGVIRRFHGIAQSPPRPRKDLLVQLTADEDTALHLLPQLGRRLVEAEVLAYLMATPDPLPTVDEVRAATGCSREILRRLAAQGLIGLELGDTRVVLLRPAEAVRQFLATDGRRAVAQARALQALLEAGGDLSWQALADRGVHRSVIHTLAARGWVQLVDEPATVHLQVPPEDALAYIVERKGLHAHLRVLEALSTVDGPVWVGWLYAETGATRRTLRDLEAAGLIALISQERWRDPLADKPLPTTPEPPPQLTPDQARVWEALRPALRAKATSASPPVFLLHGVTGSGKTEIYLRAMADVLQQGRQVLYLVPEIALTPQTIQRIAARFPGRLGVWHSELNPGERFDTWRRVRSGAVDIVVGTRSALFAPLSRLGLIVVDEEHDESYKHPRVPYYHAREVALALARLTGSVVILGSATPDVVTYTRARRGDIHLLTLPQRILAHRRHLETLIREARAARRPVPWQVVPTTPEARAIPLPPVRVVDMRLELKAGNRSIFSRALQQAMADALAAGEQVILFMNRRGRATFVLCRDCGYVVRCTRCDVPLTFHLTDEAEGEGYLLCHHCNRSDVPPARCPACGSTRIRFFGGGTQRVEAEVRRLFPTARVLRWDRDVTLERGAHWRILDTFVRHEADVLIGTQMLAKGLDLPRVTLVGVVSADEGLFLPDYRAAERTFQVLTQVAGRAGRGLWGGRVIVQTYHPEHYAIRAAAHHDYARFYRHEMRFRQEAAYPPEVRLVRLLYTHTRADKARRAAERLAADLRWLLREADREDITLIGPAPCFYPRLRGQYRWHILLRGPDPVTFLRQVALPGGWRVDVDPLNTL